MKAFAAFILFLIPLFVLGKILRNEFAPRLSDDGLLLISGLAAAALAWIWLKGTRPATAAAAPATLEDLERSLAATPALVWEAAAKPAAAEETSASAETGG